MAEDVEELRRRRMQQLIQQRLQQQQQEAVQADMQEAELSSQIKFIINQILEPEARERLSNIRLANPSYARQVEILLIQLKQAGRLPSKLSDGAFKQILHKINEGKKESRFSFKK
jgi:programmed cell death protein 5